MTHTRFDRLISAMTLVIPLFATSATLAQQPDSQTVENGRDGAAPTVAESANEVDQTDPEFDVFEIRVGGNTLLPTRVVERAVYPHLGPERTFDDLESARVSLESTYREAGFPTVLVDIPPQEVGDDGVVRFRVTEGQIDRIRVTGARYYSNRKILAALPSVKPGEALNAPSLEAELGALAQRAPARSVVPVIKAGRRPGTVDLELKVADKLPLSASVEVNDRATLDTVRQRMNINLTYNNLWQRDHSIGLQYQLTPEDLDQISVVGLTYLLRPEESSNVYALYAVRSNSDFVAAGDFGVLGEGDIVGFRAVRPIAAQGAWGPGSIALGFDYKKFNDQIVLSADDQLVTPIEYMVFSGTWSRSVDTRTGRVAMDSGAYFGVPDAFNSRAEFEDKRFKASPNFVYVKGGLSYTRPVGDRMSVLASFRGQLSDAPLIGNEQISAGGMDTVRGYFEAEQLADYGLIGTLQLNVNLPRRDASQFQWRGYGFADWAGLAVHQPLPGENRRFELASMGLGIDFSTRFGISGALQWAWPLHDATRTQGDDHRFLFRLMYATP